MTRFTSFLLVGAISLSLAADAGAIVQHVLLDFDTFTGDDPNDHTYTLGERMAVVDGLNDKFADYSNVSFTLTDPGGLPTLSTIFYNTGLGGVGDIDFQNKSKFDTATVHAPKILDVAGIPIGTATPTEIVLASINIGAHEFLHLMGTRHHDAFLPIGGGVSPGTGGSDWDPNFTGPETAFLTGMELNSLTLSLGGISAASVTDPDLVVGPRSAVKLLHEEFVDVDVDSDDENIIFSPQLLPLKTIPLPNPFPISDPLGRFDLFADMVIVEEASIAADPNTGFPAPDYYAIDADAGDVFWVEVLSDILDHRLDPFDSALAVLDPNTGFSPVPWFPPSGALNNDERESTDSLILDLTIPADGIYVVEVFANPGGADKFGDYELLIYRSFAVPIPPPVGDFDDDFLCDTTDINLMFDQGDLVSGVATTVSTEIYDLIDDNVIDNADITEWLKQTGYWNGYGIDPNDPNTPMLRGDTDNLGAEYPDPRTVDITDFENFLDGFTGAGVTWEVGNFDGDNDVDITDFTIHFLPSFLATSGGTYGPGQSIPEPSTLFLVGLGGVVMAYLCCRNNRAK